MVDPGTVVGEVSAAAAEVTGLRPGTPVAAGGGDTQLGLLGAGAQRDEYTVVAGTFWQNTVLLAEPLIDPQIRLRTLCHAVPGEWMLEGIGFYCGMSMRWFRDAFCDTEVALARARGVDPYVVMEETAAAVPAGSGGVIAILSNLMNAKRWAHASPSFLQFDMTDPAASGRGACVRAIEEAAAYVARGHRDIITELTGLTFGEVVFTGGAGRRPGRRSWPTCSGSPCTSRPSPRAAPWARPSAPALAPASTRTCSSCARACAAGRPPSSRTTPPRRRTTSGTPPGARSTGACSPITDDGLLHPLWRGARRRLGRPRCPTANTSPTGARFTPSVPARQEVFPLKGCGALDWGMQSRLAGIFRPDTRRDRYARGRPRLFPRPDHRPGGPWTVLACRCCPTLTR